MIEMEEKFNYRGAAVLEVLPVTSCSRVLDGYYIHLDFHDEGTKRALALHMSEDDARLIINALTKSLDDALRMRPF